MRVELSYEERIMNALDRLPRVKGEHFIARGQREHAAIRAVLKPLYARAEQAEARVRVLEDATPSAPGTPDSAGTP